MMADCPQCGAALPPAAMTCSLCQADVALWLARGGAVYGPYTLADLQEAQAQNRLGPADQVMIGDTGQWRPLAEFLGGATLPAALPPPPPAPTGQTPPPAATPLEYAAPPTYRKEVTYKVSGNAAGISACLILLMVFAAVAGILAAIIIPTFVRAREKAKQASCLSNLKQLSLGLLMYSQDYDERFPRAPRLPDMKKVGGPLVDAQHPPDFAAYYAPDSWRLMIFPYIKNSAIFICPQTKSAYSYQFNARLYQVPLRQCTQPALTLGIYEDGLVDHVPPPPHNGGYNAGFVDGHCKWLTAGTPVQTAP